MFTTLETDGSVVVCSTGRSKKEKSKTEYNQQYVTDVFYIVCEACYEMCKTVAILGGAIHINLGSTLFYSTDATKKKPNVFLKCTFCQIRLFCWDKTICDYPKRKTLSWSFPPCLHEEKVLSQLSNFPTIVSPRRSLVVSVGVFCKAH